MICNGGILRELEGCAEAALIRYIIANQYNGVISWLWSKEQQDRVREDGRSQESQENAGHLGIRLGTSACAIASDQDAITTKPGPELGTEPSTDCI